MIYRIEICVSQHVRLKFEVREKFLVHDVDTVVSPVTHVYISHFVRSHRVGIEELPSLSTSPTKCKFMFNMLIHLDTCGNCLIAMYYAIRM